MISTFVEAVKAYFYSKNYGVIREKNLVPPNFDHTDALEWR